jgi:hypothetical protein
MWWALLVSGSLSAVSHEFCHSVVWRWVGGRVRGVRVRWWRFAVLCDVAGVSASGRRWVALGGVMADMALGWVWLALWVTGDWPSAWVGVVWATAAVVCNLVPVRGFDGV